MDSSVRQAVRGDAINTNIADYGDLIQLFSQE